MLQILFTSLPFVLAVLLGIAVVVGPFVLNRMLSQVPDSYKAALVFWLIATIAVLNVVLLPRSLNLDEWQSEFDATRYVAGLQAAGWVARLTTLGLVGLGLAYLVGALFRRRANGQPDRAWPLGIAMGAFYIVTVAVGATLSAETSFDHRTLYIPILLGALLVLRNLDLGQVVFHLKLMLGLLMAINFLFVIFNPDYVLLRPYPGFLPGVDFRLFGVTSNANSLAPVALLLLLLEAYFPSRFGLRWPLLAMAAVTVLLTQSKTIWIAAVVLFFFSSLPQLYRGLAQRPGRDTAALILTLGVCVLVALTLSSLAFVSPSTDFLGMLSTVSGRSLIWQQTLDEFARHPYFGYGPELWGFQYRTRFGDLTAGQAHNQFLQTLGEYGLTGITLLLIYLGVLFWLSIKTFVASRGLTLALFLIILVRSLTESPLYSVVTDWPFLVQACLVVMLAYYLRQPAVERHAAVGRAA